MIVAFTARQIEAVDRLVVVSGLLRDEFAVHAMRDQYAKTGTQVDAPYAAWVMLRDLMLARLHKPSGARVRSVPRSQAAATQRVVAAINAVDRHPALRDLAMEGIQPGVFPVWRRPQADERGRIWSMWPIPGAPFVVLIPEWQINLGFTTWRPEPTVWGKDRLYDEATHLRLIGL